MIVLSSAYVCGEDAGLIQEKPFRLGKAKKGTGMIDIDIEKKLVEEKLRKLHSEHAEESAIPADMVINALIVAMLEYANQSTTSEIIYHVGSSLRNPFKFSNLNELFFLYFTQNPLIDKEGKPIKVGEVTAFSSMASFRIYMAIRYSLPLKV
uniref:Uncharacterized protein n=1 Tax=Populus alba TaxID=43335 RepID=A0A4V6A9L6_POPAL|nr:hypothetical protein D5086_0000116550 [Populus alba]